MAAGAGVGLLVDSAIQVQCVYGLEHRTHLETVLIPALAHASERPIQFVAFNYDGRTPTVLEPSMDLRVDVRNLPNIEPHAIGFAAAHNQIFRLTEPQGCFILLNPDCVPQPGALDVLLTRHADADRKVAIVEGRQWPFEHPKEYDYLTLQTPWASGAFCLIDSAFYASAKGMDETYFLYLEDVDLSWRAWLLGYEVVYERNAAVMHFSGGRFYRPDLVSNEQFYSMRNFLLISRKFFGQQGEKRARKLILDFPDHELATLAIESFERLAPKLIGSQDVRKAHDKIKILGYNRFHEMKNN